MWSDASGSAPEPNASDGGPPERGWHAAPVRPARRRGSAGATRRPAETARHRRAGLPAVARWGPAARGRMGRRGPAEPEASMRAVQLGGRSAHQGVLRQQRAGLVEAEVGERLEDGACRRLIRTWLRAGGLETAGQVLPPVTGTPQGGILSPLLAPVSLHDALDRWCHHVVKPRGGGDACRIRDADAGVCACPPQADAARFSSELGPRLGTFGRERSPDTTRVIPFTRQPVSGHTSVAWLGVELRWGRERAGKPPSSAGRRARSGETRSSGSPRGARSRVATG